MIVYLDLDGVLVDSVAEMFRRFGRGKTPKDCAGSYDTSTILGIPDPWSQFGADFFAQAAWTPDGPHILRAVEGLAGRENVRICTSPTHETTSASGKLAWIRAHLPQYERGYVLTPEKWLLASKDAVLVDDCDEQVSRFRQQGGRAVLVPRPWNSLHTLEGFVPRFVSDSLLSVLSC